MTSNGPQQPAGNDRPIHGGKPSDEGRYPPLSPEVAREIARCLREQGVDVGMWQVVIPDFLSECAVKLKDLFKSRYEAVERLMGDRFVGPSANIFRGIDVGIVLPPPNGIVEFLSAPCELAGDGRKRWETHIGAFIPERLGEVPTSILTLRRFAEECERRRMPFAPLRPSIFYGEPWYQGDPFSRTPIPAGRCVFMYEEPFPGTTHGDIRERRDRVSFSANHRLPSCLEAVGVLALHSLEYRNRYFSDLVGLTADHGIASRNIWAGLNNRDGIAIESGIILDFPRGSGSFAVFR